ncbi:hypothetical protein QJQ45_017693, partial [Haematococcus lacustris]
AAPRAPGLTEAHSSGSHHSSSVASTQSESDGKHAELRAPTESNDLSSSHPAAAGDDVGAEAALQHACRQVMALQGRLEVEPPSRNMHRLAGAVTLFLAPPGVLDERLGQGGDEEEQGGGRGEGGGGLREGGHSMRLDPTMVKEQGDEGGDGAGMGEGEGNGEGNVRQDASRASGDKVLPVTMNEMLLRGCLLKNSRWVLGLVVYAGPDSRIQMNTSRPPLKAGSLDRYLNKQIAILILFQLALSVATGVASWAWRENVGRLRPHLALDDPTQGNWQPKGQFIGLATLTAWILYSYLVPISLFVTMWVTQPNDHMLPAATMLQRMNDGLHDREIVKYTQALLYINRDPRLSTADRDTPSSAEGDKSSRSTSNAGRSEPVESGQARNSALNEDLGRVGWVFSDKTGTLTQNDMRLRQLSLRGAVVGAPPTAFRIEEADQAPGRDMLGAWDAELLQAFEQLLPHGPGDEGPWQELMRSAGQAGTGKGAGLCRSTAASEANPTQPQQGRQGSQPGQRRLATQFLDMMLALMTCHNVIIEPTASHTHGDATSVNQ